MCRVCVLRLFILFSYSKLQQPASVSGTCNWCPNGDTLVLNPQFSRFLSEHFNFFYKEEDVCEIIFYAKVEIIFMQICENENPPNSGIHIVAQTCPGIKDM